MFKTVCSSLAMFAVAVWACAGMASAAPISIKFGHDQTEQSPHQAAALLFKKLIEENSKGEMAVTIYPNMTLGSSPQMLEQTGAGAIEIVAVPTASIQGFQPTFQVLDLPFLFDSKEQLNILYKEFGKELFAPLEKKGMLGLTYWGMGFKQFTANYPIHMPSDFKGHKFRVMPSPVIREQFKALGASPVPVDFQELYNALQQGVVDGQENPLVGIVTRKLYEVQRCMVLSNHAFLAYGMVASKLFFDRLTPEQQGIVRDAAAKSAAYQLKLIDEQDQGYLDTIRKAGVTIIELTPEQRAAFRDAVKPVHAWFADTVPDGKRILDMAQQN